MTSESRRPGLQPGPVRPKLRRFHEDNYPYFVTTATVRRRPVFSNRVNAGLLADVLYPARERYGFLLLSFAVMPDHLHVVLVPRPGDTVSQVMRFIKGTYAREHNRRSRAAGAFWQAGFYDRAIRSEEDLTAAIEYIEANPVKAGIAASVADYLFSSAHASCPADLEAYLGGQAEGLAYGEASALTVAAGTSEIQRSIIAGLGLGLPRG